MAGDDTNPGASARRRLAAILAADVAGYSRLMAEDEQATLRALDAARAVFRECIEWHDGRVVDMAGDSVLAVFDAATAAVQAALAVQSRLGNALPDPGGVDSSADATFREPSDVAPAMPRMQFRVGVHLGDVMERADGTVYGDGVNIAARLEALAEPGSIAVSDAVRASVRGKLVARFDDLGAHQVKNVAEPVRAYRASESPHAHAPRRRSAGTGRRRSDQPHVLQLLLIEVFFILLPLAALWVNWDAATHQGASFSHSPAWPMTACLLYGLSIVRLLPVLQAGAAQRKRHEGTAVLLLMLLPLAGIVASVLLIARLSSGSVGDGAVIASYVNLALALLCFAVLGGWGIRGEASERGGRPLG